MPISDKMRTVTQAVYDRINGNKVTLGIQDVYYGDQDRLPRTPAVCVESGTKRRDLEGTPFYTRVSLPVMIMIYHSKIQDEQQNRKAADQLAEDIEAYLHADKQMGGTVIYGMVTEVDPGYAHRGGALLRAVRMTWEGTSKVQI